jgi:hypothetical protein
VPAQHAGEHGHHVHPKPAAAHCFTVYNLHTVTLLPWMRLQGDQLIATSGVVYNKESEYGGAKVKMGQEVVRMTVMGQVSPHTAGCAS